MVSVAVGLLSAGCSVFGIRTETTPSYTVERTIGPPGEAIELRRYEPRLAAETTVAGTELGTRSKGFGTLAGFIFGKNDPNTSIAMTAPVAQSRMDRDQWRIRFFMPDKFTAKSLPRPTDPQVAIVTVPSQRVAVLRYSGGIGPEAVQRAQQRLVRIAASAGLQTEGDPFSWFYDPPWTIPPLRRNEAAILLRPD